MYETNKRQRVIDPPQLHDSMLSYPGDLDDWFESNDMAQAPAVLEFLHEVMGDEKQKTPPLSSGGDEASGPRGGCSSSSSSCGEERHANLRGMEAEEANALFDTPWSNTMFKTLSLQRTIDTKGQMWQGTWKGYKVAVKILVVDQSKDQATQQSELRLFKKQATILEGIEHPNICQFMGCCMFQSFPALVHEFVSGGSLHTLLHEDKQKEQLSSALLCRMALELANAVAYLHSKKVVHRNIKAASVLLDDKLHVKLGDFGVSTTAASNLTAETGTYRWMAPEVIAHQPYDVKCDVHSYGMLLWEMAHRAIPFKGRGALQAAFAVVQGERPPINLHGELQALRRVIEVCFQHEPEKRPSMSHVVKMIENVSKSLPSQAKDIQSGHSLIASRVSESKQPPSNSATPSSQAPVRQTVLAEPAPSYSVGASMPRTLRQDSGPLVGHSSSGSLVRQNSNGTLVRNGSSTYLARQGSTSSFHT